MQHLEHDNCSWRARVLRHCRLAETVDMGIRSLVPIYAPTPLIWLGQQVNRFDIGTTLEARDNVRQFHRRTVLVFPFLH
jgi:hypothetical protein